MSEYNNTKYYWLKLQSSFFRSPETKILRSFPNGREYILIYLNLLLESVPHEGHLRFSESIPYSTEMIAALTDSEAATAESAMKILEDLALLEKQEDGTLYFPELESMVGSSTEGAEHKRAQRRTRRERESGKTGSGQMADKCPGESETEKKEKDTETECGNRNTAQGNDAVVPPTEEEVENYCAERKNGINAKRFIDYYKARGWHLNLNTKMKDLKAAVRLWETRNQEEQKASKEKSSFDLNTFFKDAVSRTMESKREG